MIAIFPNSKKESRALAKEIRQFLKERQIIAVAEDEDAKELGAVPMSQINPLEIDFLLSLGGDGAILRLVHKYEHLKAAILGINLGHLGFMADVPLSDLYPSLQDLINGAYRIEERVAIEGRLLQGGRCFAVNEIVVHRGKNHSLVEIAIHVDGIYLNTFQADGVIIATPTGSTAYSLAAGGPILNPTLEALVLTPISPHTISNRPLVMTSSQEIQIQSLNEDTPLEIRADGLIHYELHPKDVFRITRNAKNFRLVSLLRRDYFSTLRTKLGWSGKLR